MELLAFKQVKFLDDMINRNKVGWTSSIALLPTNHDDWTLRGGITGTRNRKYAIYLLKAETRDAVSNVITACMGSKQRRMCIDRTIWCFAPHESKTKVLQQ